VCVCARTRGFPLLLYPPRYWERRERERERERDRERARVSGARDIRAHRRSDRASKSGLRHIL